MLADAKSSPDFNNYLLYLVSSSAPPEGLSYRAEDWQGIRSIAAITLKNNVRTEYAKISAESLALIQSTVLVLLHDKSASVRNLAGNVITELVTKGGILAWPNLLVTLIALVGNANGSTAVEAQEGAMQALAKICEDNKKMLDRDIQGQRPLSILIPKLITFTSSELPKIRSLAIGSVNVFVPHKSEAVLANLDNLLNRLFALAHDDSAEVRRQVCRAFVQIIEICPDKILPHLAGVVDYMLQQQQKTDDEELATDAAEFWLTVGEHQELWQSLEPYLTKIIPVLLQSMVYSGEDIALLEGGADDDDEEDRQEDIKPAFATSKNAKGASNGVPPSASGDQYSKASDMEDDVEDGEIEESDDDDGDEAPEDRWNLRKCSAAALDVFATDFRGAVFGIILPYLTDNLKSPDWPLREAAVLALGAVADGCMEVVSPHLPELVPYLITLLRDAEPLVRQITCWTLGRYSSWASSLGTAEQRKQYFEPMMEGLLTRMLDRNKRVQEASASAMAHLEEKAGATLTPYCGPIISQFVQCFGKYKDRNMFILYDCVQTLAEHVGHGLADPQLINLLMPALIGRWHKVHDQSRELFPLLECLSYVAAALGPSFVPFAPALYERCIRVIHTNLEDHINASHNPHLDVPDKDFLVTSLDLLSAIVQALDEDQAVSLVASTKPTIFDLLQYCMEHRENEVRQSAYALLGDCAKCVYPQLRASLPTLLPLLIQQLDLDNMVDELIETGFSVVNNACWSAGEISMQHGKAMEQYAQPLLKRYLDILGNDLVTRSVLENSAIALGRLGLGCAESLAPHLTTISTPFLTTIDTVDFTLEKATATQGFLLVVLANPAAMEQDLAQLFTLIARFRRYLESETSTTQELKQICQHVSLCAGMTAQLAR